MTASAVDVVGNVVGQTGEGDDELAHGDDRTAVVLRAEVADDRRGDHAAEVVRNQNEAADARLEGVPLLQRRDDAHLECGTERQNKTGQN